MLPMHRAPGADSCIAEVASNLARGNGNFFLYYQFSAQEETIKAGDTFVYRVYLDPKNPVAKGGIDIEFADNATPLRDLELTDQNGIRAHGDGELKPAVGKWYERRIPLDRAVGRITHAWELQLEGDAPGEYVQFIDDVRIEHGDKSATYIYKDGGPPMRQLQGYSGYSQQVAVLEVATDQLLQSEGLRAVIAKLKTRWVRLRTLEVAQQDINLVKKFLARNPDPIVAAHTQDAIAMLDKAMRLDSTNEQIEAALHSAQHALSHAHPVMAKYTGHLVGHAHIDLQWLWEWQEGLIFSRDTFNQALKFMDEYPGFTFSQSSSALYQAMEENYPEIFARMKAKIKSGQWEIVGGRICEGDTNMISAESHARHFLYGQRYFREQFGKTAVVGWEPDTFGHTAQMPQILKLGGCNYYYFCRGGKGKPLFWWKGLDGSRVLAFDEPATGSWYNSDLSYQQFQEMLDFEQSGNSGDSLMVYGVGNHGGGPTRENIETALGWMKDPSKPKVKFSTATQFFKKLETYDLTKIPVIQAELNPVFDGCYTSHSEIKQLNREAENLTTSAEALASVASLYGYHYPQAMFRKNWEDIGFNHHHDTLPGSGIHAPYERTKTALGRVIADDKDAITRALESLVIRQTPYEGGISQLVFNPTGWKRSGWVECNLVQSGWDGGNRLELSQTVAVSSTGSESAVWTVDEPSRRVRFYAEDIPAFGFRSYHLTRAATAIKVPELGMRGNMVDTGFYHVEFDMKRGCISHLVDTRTNKDLAGPKGLGDLEIHHENHGGMTAWVIGNIDSVSELPVVSQSQRNGPGYVEVSFTHQIPAANHGSALTTVTQHFRVPANADPITVDVDCDWQSIGTSETGAPMLRVAFDTAIKNPKATYEVPFGTLERPIDGRENVALRWAALTQGTEGLAVLNDSKYGYSATDSTLRLSLIRSSYDPDPVPNPGLHHWRYALMPLAGDGGWPEVIHAGAEFNQPLLNASIPFDAKGTAPKDFSAFSFNNPSVIPTCLKLGEDHQDWIVRVYEGTGKSAKAQLNAFVPTLGARWVNFLEDDLGAAVMAGSKLNITLHPFEIRTVKFVKSAKVKA